MNQDMEESIWQKLSTAFFGVRKIADERLFTARVMAEIRSRQPDARPWHAFTRWAIPALALSMGGFTIAAVYSLKPIPLTTESLLLGEQEPDQTDDWLAASPADEETMPQQEAVG